MIILSKLASFSVLILVLTAISRGGELHVAKGASREAAIDAANSAANAAARKKSTGWKPARAESAKQNGDGSWTAQADSANEKGSLARGGYLLPTDTLPKSSPAPQKSPEKEGISNPVLGAWRFDNTWKDWSLKEIQTHLYFFNDDGDVAVKWGVQSNGRSGRWNTDTYKWRSNGTVIEITKDGKRHIGFNISEEGKELTYIKDVESGHRVRMTREKLNYLFFAAICEGGGNERKRPKVVVDEVREETNSAFGFERELNREVRTKYQSTDNIWVVHVVPESACAIIYSFTWLGNKGDGIAVARGASMEEAERDMEKQIEVNIRKDPKELRRWPATWKE